MGDSITNEVERRDFLRFVAAGAALFFSGTAHSQRRPAKRPNVIVIITDDQDKDSIGAYGGISLTPNLDRMAREGMVFHQAYVSSTVCTPSRYSFLTGRYAGRSHDGRYMQECPASMQSFPSFNMELEQDNMNIGAALCKRGYITGYVGKFHVGPDIKRPDEYEQFGLKYVAKDAPRDSKSTAAFRSNERRYRDYLEKKGFSWAKHIYWGNMSGPFAHHNPEWTVEAALEFIEANKDGPFYLHYCTTLTHGPDKSWRVSMDNPRVSGEGMLDKLPDVMTDRKVLLERLRKKGLDPGAGHAGYVWTDDSVGAILSKLDDLGIAENTLVVFTSDHGSNMKGSLYNIDGTSVPCIMRWPQGIKAGTECHELIQNIDFVPTFLDITEARVPRNYAMDGRSLRPLFGGGKPARWRGHLYFEIGAARAVCTKDWKYIAVRYSREQVETIKRCPVDQLPRHMAYIGRMGIGTRGANNPNFFDADQLYHVKEDPRELNNLATSPEHRQKLKQMKNVLAEYLKSFGRPFGEFVPGGNAVPSGLIDKQIHLVKQIKISGKKVLLPQGVETDTIIDKKQRRSQKRKVQL